MRTQLCLFALAGSLLLCAGPAAAEVVRFHFTPADLCGHTALKPGPNGATGEWQTWRGALRRQPYYCQKAPTHIVTFRHPYTCQNVNVPLALPEGTPRIEYVSDRVIFNYGSYTVETRFFADGSVDTIYDSGFLRPL